MLKRFTSHRQRAFKFNFQNAFTAKKFSALPKNYDLDQQTEGQTGVAEKGDSQRNCRKQDSKPMTTAPSRRAFLRGRFQETAPLRPFGAIAEFQFSENCTGCGDCVRACPEAIIVQERAGLPVLDLNAGGCTFCGECITACETGALTEGASWTWKADATQACLSRNAVQCRTCQDHCDERAIRFQLLPGGRAEPKFDADLCTGCGACSAPCPVGAIKLTQFNPPKEAQSC
ncbi:MAG: ferredoxin-type protein NapF [Rhodobacteraceae bacterium]|nr:ferredoxin-type protein NapF [Paracoccaceae bacterium]